MSTLQVLGLTFAIMFAVAVVCVVRIRNER